MTNNHFSPFVASQLQHYVYRLIDPRTGMTFYVGRGQGDRVFSHASGELGSSGEEDDESLKLRRIRAIRNSGLDVQHIIHRHGLSERESREVESALIDAFPGLTNIQGGYDASRGAMHSEQVINLYEAKEAVFKHKLLLINVNLSSEELDVYHAVRFAWRISPANAAACDYVLAVQRGVIIGVFQATAWLPATAENFPFPPAPGRFGFVGQEAAAEIRDMYIHKRIPATYRRRGAASPIRYVSADQTGASS